MTKYSITTTEMVVRQFIIEAPNDDDDTLWPLIIDCDDDISSSGMWDIVDIFEVEE